jgi:hypothetical protein
MKLLLLTAVALFSLGLNIANAEPVGHADPGAGASPSTWTAGAAGWG